MLEKQAQLIKSLFSPGAIAVRDQNTSIASRHIVQPQRKMISLNEIGNYDPKLVCALENRLDFSNVIADGSRLGRSDAYKVLSTPGFKRFEVIFDGLHKAAAEKLKWRAAGLGIVAGSVALITGASFVVPEFSLVAAAPELAILFYAGAVFCEGSNVEGQKQSEIRNALKNLPPAAEQNLV